MNAGRELDTLVAEKVMGWLPGPPGFQRVYPQYSTAVSAAWLVVEKLRSEGWLVVIKEMPDGFPYRSDDDAIIVKRRCVCELSWMPRRTQEDTRRYAYMHPVGAGDTTPEAICRAALEMVELNARWSSAAKEQP